MEKSKALCHRYEGLAEKIDKYGCDGKQLHHLYRLYEFLYRYIQGEPLENCYKSKQQYFLINLKKQLISDGTKELYVEKATKMANECLHEIDNLINNNILEKDQINEKGLEVLNNFKFKILEKKFKKDLTLEK